MGFDHETFLGIVKNAPLVSIDLIVRDPNDRVLLGLRVNEPARDTWFVPGGRVWKEDANLDAAFTRIALAELDLPLKRKDARFLGVYEHRYPTNFAGRPGIDTYYIVLAHEVRLATHPTTLPADQHTDYRWFTPEEALTYPGVHENTRAYFRAG